METELGRCRRKSIRSERPRQLPGQRPRRWQGPPHAPRACRRSRFVCPDFEVRHIYDPFRFGPLFPGSTRISWVTSVFLYVVAKSAMIFSVLWRYPGRSATGPQPLVHGNAARPAGEDWRQDLPTRTLDHLPDGRGEFGWRRERARVGCASGKCQLLGRGLFRVPLQGAARL